MKIAIDVSSVVYGTGVSVYTRELVGNLLKIDHDNDYILFGYSLRRKHELSQFLATLKGASFKGKIFPIAPTVADWMWNRMRFPKIERLIGKIDILHTSDWVEPPSKAIKITTVHDLTPVLYPEWSHPKIVSVHKARLELVKKESKHIIVPSETTKKDLTKLGFSQEVSVISEASSNKIVRTSASEVNNAKNRFGINGEYIISVGVHPRKNTQGIIAAFKKLKEDFSDLKLVLVGNSVGMQMANEDDVIYTGFLGDNDLSALITGAKALVYPSFYEGFGIPILDAYKIGTPVVTSNVGSMKEVAGNAAVLVNPHSVESIVNGVKQAFLKSESLVKKGNLRVKQFSWEKMARQTLRIYESF